MTNGAERMDVGLLLSRALDEQPPPDLPERVVATLALLATGVELFRLASDAPLSPLAPRGQVSERDAEKEKEE